jgi:VWFA-related protein
MRKVRVPTLVLVAASVGAVAAQQPPSTFRTAVTVIPVDVRVVDRSGKPITDLKAGDFTILEDGVPQEIVHFSFEQLRAASGAAAPAPSLEIRKPLGDTVTAQDKRVFLIVLGRGRQVGPVKGVEAARRFINDRLLPQDQVAVLAYNRSTNFTTDHRNVVETLDRYWKKHESIEARLRQHFSGLAAAYGSREIPAGIQADIDAIFKAPGALASRTVDAIDIPDQARRANDDRRNRDAIERAEIAAERLKAGMGTPFDEPAVNEAAMLDEGFDAYVEKSFDTETDLGNLYAGVRYLRWMDGEKHLVFITPGGLYLPRLESAHSLAALASDARVTVSVIHTYGSPPAQILGPGGRVTMASGFGQLFQNSNSRQIAALTGGQMTSTRTGDAFFRALDETTRAQYLLGYTPANGTWDGKYRRIQVRVNRRDAQVLHRQGYAARREVAAFDRQQYLLYSRIAGAANLPRDIGDLAIALDEPSLSTTPAGLVLTVPLRILPGAGELRLEDGFHVGKMELVAVCADRKQLMVGEIWQTIDFRLTEENYRRFRETGATLTLTIGVAREPQYVKAILYDYGADLVGSRMVELKQK